MSSTGNVFAGTGENNAGIGATAWTNPGNVTANDTTDATCNAGASSQYLVARNFGFALPAGATIAGITVSVEASEHSAGTETFFARLQDDTAALVGSSKSVSLNGTTKTVYTYGGTADVWGATLTQAIVNNANFGVRFWFTTSHDVRIDYVQMAVEYTVGSTALTTSVSTGGQTAPSPGASYTPTGQAITGAVQSVAALASQTALVGTAITSGQGFVARGGGQEIVSGSGSVVGGQLLAGAAITSGQGDVATDAGAPVAEIIVGAESAVGQGSSAQGLSVRMRSRKVGGGAATFALGSNLSAVSIGAVSPVPQLRATSVAALLSPGAFGQARNLSLTGSASTMAQGAAVGSGGVGSGSALGTSFTLTSTSTGTKPFVVGFGFKQGDVASGAGVVVSGASAYQVTAKRTWNDGSLKHAIIAGTASLTANTPLTLSLAAGTSSGGTALTSADITAAAPTASVQCGAFGTVSLASLLASPVRTWISGPQMVECHYRGDVGGGTLLSVWFHVRLWANGGKWVRAIVENGLLDNGAGALASNANQSYIPTVIIGGTTVYNNGGASLTHYRNSRWIADGWIGTDPAVTPSHNTAYLRDSKLVPNYGLASTPSSTALNAVVQTYTPFTVGALEGDVQGGGFHQYVGVLSQWDALYCTSGDKRALAGVVAASKELNSYGICWRDATNRNVPKPSDFSNWSIDGPAAGGYSNWNNGYHVWDMAHNPSVGYMAYLATGDYLHYETLLMNVATMYLSLGSGYTDSAHAILRGNGTSRLMALEVRSTAWGLRAMSQLAALAPDADLAAGQVAAEYQSLLSNNVAYWKTQADIPINGLGYLYTYTGGGTGLIGHNIDGDGASPPWMQNFWSISLGHGSDIEPLGNMTTYNAVRDWVYKGVVGLLGDSSGYHYSYASAYDVLVAPVNTVSNADNFYDSWATVFAQTWGSPSVSDTLRNTGYVDGTGFPARPWPEVVDGSGNPAIAQSAGSRWAQVTASLAYAVDHGAVGASQSYARVTGASNWSTFAASGFSDAPMWGLAPREPAWLRSAAPAVNQWVQISGSAMSNTPSSAFQQIGGASQSYKQDHWSGFSIDTRNNKIWALGIGGHGDYFGNEVMVFDAMRDSPTWVEWLPPTPYNNTFISTESRPSSPRILARHTDQVGYVDRSRLSGEHAYYSQQFIERHNRAMRVYSGSVSSGPGTGFADMDGFDCTAAQGVNGTDPQYTYPVLDNGNFLASDSGGVIGPNYLFNGNDISPTCKNPDTEEIWVLKQNNYLKKFTPSAGGPSGSAGSGGTWSANLLGSAPAAVNGLGGAMTFNTRTKKLFFACLPYSGGFGGSLQQFFSFNTLTNTWDAELTGSMSGAGLASLRDLSSGMGLVYVPALNAYLAIGHTGAVWKIDATTLVVTVLSTTGSAPPATAELGGDAYATYENVYTKVLFAPSLRGLLYGPGYTSDMHFLRLY